MEKRKKVAFLTKNPPASRGPKKSLSILEKMEKETRHYWMATSVMAALRYYILDMHLSSNLIEREVPYTLFIELTNGEEYSCFCSGYNKYIDVQKLIPWGKPDPNFEEKRFSSPIRVAIFLEKELSKGGVNGR